MAIWDASAGRALPPVLLGDAFGHKFQLNHVIQAVAVDPSGRYVAAAGSQVNEGRAKIWDLEQGGSETVLPGIGSQIFTLGFSKDGKNLVAGCQDSTVRVWEVKSGAESITLRGHRSDVQALDFDRSGLRLATAAGDGQLLLWDRGIPDKKNQGFPPMDWWTGIDKLSPSVEECCGAAFSFGGWGVRYSVCAGLPA